MRSRRFFSIVLALCAVLWVFTYAEAHAQDRVGTPYRGPIELTGSGGGGSDSGDSGGDTGGDSGGDGGDGGGGGDDGSGGSDGPTPGGGTTGGPGGKTAKLDGPILWQWWWEHNKDRYLANATRRGRVNMGSSYYWFGGGAKFPPREIEGVSLKQRRDPVFATLKKVLNSEKNAGVRAEAAIALGRVGYVAANKKQRKDDESDNLVVRELIRTINKSAPAEVHHSCFLALGMCRDEDAVQFILRNYTKFPGHSRPYANVALGLSGFTSAVPHLLDTMPKSAKRDASDEAVAAIHALGLIGPSALAEMSKEGRDGEKRLLKLVDKSGKDKTVMQAVATAARLHIGRAAVGKIVNGKCSKNVNWAALLALSNYYHDEKDAKEAAKILQKSRNAFKSGAGQDKNFAILSLGELARRLSPNSKARADILKFLKSKQVILSRKDNYVRACAAVALGCAGDRTAIPIIADLLTDTTGSDYVVAAACIGLGLLKANAQADKIRDTVMLKTKWNADARGYAALGIALMGDTTRLDELQRFERSKLSNNTRRQVTLALALLGDKKNVRQMQKFFSKTWKRSERYEISNAAYGLAWIRDQSAIDGLAKTATGASDPGVRGMAVIALGYTAARDRVSPLASCYENQSYRNRFGLWQVLEQIARIL